MANSLNLKITQSKTSFFKELTSRIMSVMTLVGGLDRLTMVLTTSYNDFTDGSRSQFQDLDSRIG